MGLVELDRFLDGEWRAVSMNSGASVWTSRSTSDPEASFSVAISSKYSSGTPSVSTAPGFRGD